MIGNNYEDIEQNYVDYYYETIESFFEDEIVREAERLIDSVVLPVNINDIDVYNILCNYDIERNIRAYVLDMYFSKDEEIDDYGLSQSINDWEQIHDLFTREQDE